MSIKLRYYYYTTPAVSYLLPPCTRQYRQWTHIRTYGTDVFAMDMLSSISQASGDKLMKPMAFYCVFYPSFKEIIARFLNRLEV